MSPSGPHGLLARLQALDPARDDSGPRASSQDTALHHILNSPRDRSDEALVPRRGSRPTAVASVLAALVLALGAVVWSLAPGQVYATWTPSPEPVSPELRQEVLATCPMVAHEVVGEGEDADVMQVSLEPVLIDVRGDHTYVISADEAGRYAECFVTHQDGEVRALAATDAGQPAALPMTAAEGITVLQSGTSEWSQEDDEVPGALTSAFGYAGDDVARVVLRTEAGEQVQATVEGGWWAAWAPGDDAFERQISVVGEDGTTTQQPMEPAGS